MDTGAKSADLGYFGNIWVRQNVLAGVNNSNQGHEHHFDHVSLLVEGVVRVHVDGYPSKEFTAPTFIVVRKEHRHRFECLSERAVWYCVFALRDLDGEPIEDLYGAQHDPLCSQPVHEGFWEAQKAFDRKTTITS